MHPLVKVIAVGTRFGRLTVLERAGSSPRGQALWRCRCDCGNLTTPSGNALRSGQARSCGCLNHEETGKRSTRHGHAPRGHQSPEYRVYMAMLARCYRRNSSHYDDYGGRGIRVCRRWQGEHGFEHFLADMGSRPSLQHSLDRYPDNDGNYEPTNCRWATKKQQARNRRSSLVLTVDGVSATVAEWAEKTGVPAHRLYCRKRVGWSDEDAVKRPPRRFQ